MSVSRARFGAVPRLPPENEGGGRALINEGDISRASEAVVVGQVIGEEQRGEERYNDGPIKTRDIRKAKKNICAAESNKVIC